MFQNYQEAIKYIYSLIPDAGEDSAASDDSSHKFPGERGLERMKALLALLGDPQEDLRVIHVAGTSGKGSTAYLTSLVLQSQGFKVGLTMSPHIVDIRERVQIGQECISKEDFVKNLNEILPAVERLKRVEGAKFGKPTYFEVLMALAFFSFKRAQVDYAVVEVGLGGLLDGTNTIKRKDKICVINKIGKDHMHILGDTLEEIACQKAGIVQPGNEVFVIRQDEKVIKTIKEVSARRGASNVCVVEAPRSMSFDFKFLGCDWQGLQLGLMGQHQVENCSLALSVLARLSQRDGFSLDEKPMRKALKGARLVGRFDKRQVGEVSVILDGAHNPQKIEAFAGALENAYPNEKFVFLFAVKWDKDFESILALLRPIAKKFVLTTFSGEGQDFKHSSVHPTKIAKSLEKTKFYQYEIEENVQAALKKALNYAGQEKERVVVTGSLYLLGEVYQLL